MSRPSLGVLLALVSVGTSSCYLSPPFEGPYQCLDDGTCGDTSLTCEDGICCQMGGTPACPSYINPDGTCPGGGQPITYFQDLDGDGYGNDNAPKRYCLPPVTVPFVLEGGDCNDNPAAGGAASYPGANEQCDGADNNCNGQIDEGLTPQDLFCRDQDGDDYGDPARCVTACGRPPGYVPNNSDCDATNPAVNPGVIEECNRIDDNCDGNTDNVAAAGQSCTDPNREGVCAPGARACTNGVMVCEQLVYPGTETCDGVDEDCDGVADNGLPVGDFYRDQDSDGYGDPLDHVTACAAPAGYVADKLDCAPTVSSIHPNGVEVCNGLDDNCNGRTDETAPENGQGCTDSTRKGICQAGVRRCVEGGTGTFACDQTVFAQGNDVCDSLDNDCDGQTDERPDCGGPYPIANSGSQIGAKHMLALYQGAAPNCVKSEPSDDTVADTITASGLLWHGEQYESHIAYFSAAPNKTWDLSRAGATLRINASVNINSTSVPAWASHHQPIVHICGANGGFIRMVYSPAYLIDLNNTGVYTIDSPMPLGVAGSGWVVGSGTIGVISDTLKAVKSIEIMVQPESASPWATFDINFSDTLFGFP